MDTDQLISLWEDIVTNYPIFSIEDPLDEEGRKVGKNNRCSSVMQNPISWR